MRSPRLGSVVVAAVVAMSCFVPSAVRADHEDGFYSQPTYSQFTSSMLDVLIVPPNHGQLINGDTGVLGGSDPNELTPNNSYLAALEEAVAAWDRAVNELGSEWLKSNLVTNVYVVGRDAIPPSALATPEIVIGTDETQGFTLGTAYRAPVCFARISKLEILSFSYVDMYNIGMHEYGHCLGLGHMGDQGGVDPTSEQKHPEHDVMNGFYTHFIGDEGTHRHCISNLNVAGLEWVFRNPATGVPIFGSQLGGVEMAVADYGDTCVAPPASWSPPNPTPAPQSSASPPPSPQPAPASSPSGSPTPSPSPTEAAPQEDHERSITLRLRRHLVARGRVESDFGPCRAGEVHVFRKTRDQWLVVATPGTDAQGGFRAKLPDRSGRYLATISMNPLADGSGCSEASSAIARHRHR